MEKLLTKDELDEIIKESKKYDYTDYKEGFFGRKSTDIIRQDKETKLIITKGNEYTGYEHIINRHFGSEMKFYWNTNIDQQKIKLNNPTIFRGNIVPYTILKYAQQIFKPSLKIVSLNEGFDIFEGSVNYGKDNCTVKSRLLTYKNFPIVHTFYISQLANYKNKNKLNKYFRGNFSAKNDYFNNIVKYNCTFFDSTRKEVFEYIQIEDNHKLELLIQISINGVSYNVHSEKLIKKKSLVPEQIYLKDRKINDQYEKKAILKYEEIKKPD